MDIAEKELELLEREEEYVYNIWNFRMLLIIGFVLVSAGILRILFDGFLQLNAINLVLITVGAFLLSIARYWSRKKKPTDEEVRMLDEEENNQYEIESASFGFQDKYYKSTEREKYMETELKAEPDIRAQEDLNTK